VANTNITGTGRQHSLATSPLVSGYTQKTKKTREAIPYTHVTEGTPQDEMYKNVKFRGEGKA
jgi:hypothetical protein